MSIHIIGAGGHARVLGALFRLTGNAVIYHATDDTIPAGEPLRLGIGNRARIGDSGLYARKAIYEKFRDRICWIIAEKAHCMVDVAAGAQVLTGAIVNPGATIGENALVNTGAIVEHDCIIGAHSHVAPGAVVCGGARIGALTHVGSNAVVKQGVVIGDRCVIGMGAIVYKNLPSGATILGPTPIIITDPGHPDEHDSGLADNCVKW